jgi:SAM-dependent methyltransferase
MPDNVFEGSVPQLYDQYLVPLIFDPYSIDLAGRLVQWNPESVLEVACGSGSVTRKLASFLQGTRIVATDFNQPMLDRAAAIGTSRAVEWQKADAMNLPFPDESFDAIACQFGVMFVSDRPRAFSEARRVLKRGGRLVFSTWDRIEENEFADVVTDEMARLFPGNPPQFLARTPHGYNDRAKIEQDVRLGGFESPQVETVAKRSRAYSARVPAVGYCQGTPLRDELFARDPSCISEATNLAEKAIMDRYGSGAVDAKIQAHVISARKE